MMSIKRMQLGAGLRKRCLRDKNKDIYKEYPLKKDGAYMGYMMNTQIRTTPLQEFLDK